ncbi:30S ribosomal protein S15 [bacterium HR11]|nr:30S ribosomal protein S15 [bacterium HR11]
MPITRQDKAPVIEQFRRHETDTGSTEIVIALLTQRIQHLSEHLRRHPKDFSSKRGLLRLVGRRRRLLAYLRRKDFDRYQQVIQALGLRK